MPHRPQVHDGHHSRSRIRCADEGNAVTPAVFLDRDGTLIEDVDYLNDLNQIALFPWTVDALRLLNRAGFATIVVTNQSAVARGIVSEDFVGETHAALDE